VRPGRWGIILWSVLIVVLLIVEVAQLTHLFTVPIANSIGDPLAFIFSLFFTTIVALVGAIFIGIYVSARVLRSGGFTPFEEEMLRMRADVRDLKVAVEELRSSVGSASRADPRDPPKVGGR
jgi:hypothetical protein